MSRAIYLIGSVSLVVALIWFLAGKCLRLLHVLAHESYDEESGR